MSHTPTPRDPNKPRLTIYRSRHRSRSHDEAHDGEHAVATHAVPDHPLIPPGEPRLISTASEAETLFARLGDEGRFAFDTEFIGEQSYHPRLCLVQVASAQTGISLIDPMAGVGLRGFWELVADDRVEKIVHAGLQDLEPVVRHLDAPPRRVFDTQLAAGFAGLAYPMSLDKLVLALAGVNPQRGAKFSQWDRRPLTAVQLRYAANDVRYLLLLRQALGEKLEAMGNTAWAAARCGELSDLALYRFDPRSQRIRVRGVEWLSPPQRAVLRALLSWREAMAMEEDVPPRTLMRDDVLMDMARLPIASVADLSQVRGLPRPVVRRDGDTLVSMIRDTLAAPLDDADLDAPVGRDRMAEQTVDRLWPLVQQHCQSRGVDPAVVTSKRDLTAMIRQASSGNGFTAHRLVTGWRADFLAPILAELEESSQP